MDLYYAAVNAMRLFALSVGSFVILAGIARGALVARGAGGRARTARQIGEHAALGLDLFVGATLLNLAIDPTWSAVATTAIIIVVRKLLTFSLSLPQRQADPGPPMGS
ncbi:MAG: DUF1622 domain-containing protein [Rubrobacteraceae bacterium]|nr:DUF1622 domain-containing protein [Rubrobacteraceae bacterium]